MRVASARPRLRPARAAVHCAESVRTKRQCLAYEQAPVSRVARELERLGVEIPELLLRELLARRMSRCEVSSGAVALEVVRGDGESVPVRASAQPDARAGGQLLGQPRLVEPGRLDLAGVVGVAVRILSRPRRLLEAERTTTSMTASSPKRSETRLEAQALRTAADAARAGRRPSPGRSAPDGVRASDRGRRARCTEASRRSARRSAAGPTSGEPRPAKPTGGPRGRSSPSQPHVTMVHRPDDRRRSGVGLEGVLPARLPAKRGFDQYRGRRALEQMVEGPLRRG